MTKGIFDNLKRTIAERNEHLNDKLDVDQLTEQVKNEMHRGQSGEGYKGASTERYLEQLGTYLINSPDIETHRKVENSFYLNEKDYLEHNKTGRNTYADSEEVNNELEMKYEFDNDNLELKYVMRLFNPQKLSEDDLRRFIINWGNYTNIDNKLLREEIEDLQSEIESVANAKDFEMLSLFGHGLNVTECAKELGSTHQAVSDRIKKLINRYTKQLARS